MIRVLGYCLVAAILAPLLAAAAVEILMEGAGRSGSRAGSARVSLAAQGSRRGSPAARRDTPAASPNACACGGAR